MLRFIRTLTVFVSLIPTGVLAQNCTEQFVRDIWNKPSGTPAEAKASDVYFFAPFLEKPVVGSQEWKSARERKMGDRKNVKDEYSKIDSVVVSASGDMAYAYGTSHGSWDDAQGEHHDSTTAFLDVWKLRMVPANLQREWFSSKETRVRRGTSKAEHKRDGLPVRREPMRVLTITLAFTTLFGVAAVAQNGPCTEAAIRDAISRHDPNWVTDDFYFFSPAFNQLAQR